MPQGGKSKSRSSGGDGGRDQTREAAVTGAEEADILPAMDNRTAAAPAGPNEEDYVGVVASAVYCNPLNNTTYPRHTPASAITRCYSRLGRPQPPTTAIVKTSRIERETL